MKARRRRKRKRPQRRSLLRLARFCGSNDRPRPSHRREGLFCRIVGRRSDGRAGYACTEFELQSRGSAETTLDRDSGRDLRAFMAHSLELPSYDNPPCLSGRSNVPILLQPPPELGLLTASAYHRLCPRESPAFVRLPRQPRCANDDPLELIRFLCSDSWGVGHPWKPGSPRRLKPAAR